MKIVFRFGKKTINHFIQTWIVFKFNFKKSKIRNLPTLNIKFEIWSVLSWSNNHKYSESSLVMNEANSNPNLIALYGMNVHDTNFNQWYLLVRKSKNYNMHTAVPHQRLWCYLWWCETSRKINNVPHRKSN